MFQALGYLQVVEQREERRVKKKTRASPLAVLCANPLLTTLIEPLEQSERVFFILFPVTTLRISNTNIAVGVIAAYYSSNHGDLWVLPSDSKCVPLV